MAKNPTYIDLFAGCGGLSLGLEQAGFDLVLAVEKSPMAAETFYHNFIERIQSQEDWERFAGEGASTLGQARKKLVVKELSAVLDEKALLRKLLEDNIDLVAGGPPCQGFSLAGRRNPDDARNKLPWQFLEFVEAIEPKAVIIENVSGMSQDFKKHGKLSPFDELRIALSNTGPGYEVQPMLLNAMHFGVPQHRPRVMLVGLRKDVAAIAGVKGSEHTWRSEFDDVGSLLFRNRPSLAPVATHFGDNILTVADAISDLSQRGYRRKSNISEFAKEMRDDTGWMPARIRKASQQGGLANHALRRHAGHIETRFRLYQYFRDAGIHPRVMGLPKLPGIPEEGIRQLVAEAVRAARMPAVAPDGTVIARTRPRLVDLIMSLGTKKHSQRPLSWRAPSPTVVSLPDDYVHPEEPRTLTVREMARFQSFPDSFEFRAKETTGSLRRRFEVPQYTQVGNAVPPRLARAVGLSVKEALERSQASQRRKAS
jgi:DNA (cytosine-5)-methyltransferase 1